MLRIDLDAKPRRFHDMSRAELEAFMRRGHSVRTEALRAARLGTFLRSLGTPRSVARRPRHSGLRPVVLR